MPVGGDRQGGGHGTDGGRIWNGCIGSTSENLAQTGPESRIKNKGVSCYQLTHYIIWRAWQDSNLRICV